MSGHDLDAQSQVGGNCKLRMMEAMSLPSDLDVIVFGVNPLHGICRQDSWSIVHNESSDTFTCAYNGISLRTSVLSLLKQCTLRLCSHGDECEFCEQVRNLQQSQEVACVLQDLRQRLPVEKKSRSNVSTIGSGTASQATPHWRRHMRARADNTRGQL